MMIDLNDKKILLVRNDNVGDLICTTPAIEALRKRYPDNQIDIVVNSYNYDAIHNNPFVNTIYCYTKPKHKTGKMEKIKAGWGKLKILWQIRKENYDVVVVFRSGYSRSAELFSTITSATYKVGVKNPKGKDNFNIHIPVKKERHEVEFCFDCLAPFGVEQKDEKTRFYVEDTGKYKAYENMVVFHISARMKENKMDFEKLKSIITRLDIPLYITAEPDDFAMARKLEAETQATFMQTDSFKDLGMFIKNAKLFVTLEGGTMHLAPAIGVKTLALFGKSDISKWYPWGYRDLVLQDESKVAQNIDTDTIVRSIKDNL